MPELNEMLDTIFARCVPPVTDGERMALRDAVDQLTMTAIRKAWIPVTSMYPPPGMRALLFFPRRGSNGSVFTGWWEQFGINTESGVPSGQWSVDTTVNPGMHTYALADEVTHWQPLPAGPVP